MTEEELIKQIEKVINPENFDLIFINFDGKLALDGAWTVKELEHIVESYREFKRLDNTDYQTLCSDSGQQDN